MKRLLTLFLIALLTLTVTRAADLTYTWSSWTQGTLAGAPSGVSANFVTTYNGYNNQGVQLTSGNSLTLTLSGFTSSHKLTGISIRYCTNKSAGEGSVSASLGNSSVANDCSLAYSGSGDGRTLKDAIMDVTETVFDGNDLVLTVTATTNSVYVNSFTVSYAEAGGTQVYKKVTNAFDLVADKQYIIVNEDNGIGMGPLATSGNKYGTAISGLSIENDKVDIGGTNVMEMTLGGSASGWTFNMGTYYLGNNENNNYFSQATNPSNPPAKWTVTPSATSSTLKNNYTNSYIKYNSSTSVFGCYGENAQLPVALYVKYEGVTDAPQFSPADGSSFAGSQEVTITCGTDDDAVIYYTTDGSEPTMNSTLYSGPFTINATTTIKAIAIAPAKDASDVVTATYTNTAVSTLAEANALATGTQFTFTGNVVVTYSGVYNNNRYTWLRDLNGTRDVPTAGVFYNTGGELSKGDVLALGWQATKTVYNNWIEYTSASNISVSSNGTTVNPIDRTGVVLSDDNMNEYIAINNVKVTSNAYGNGNINYDAVSADDETKTYLLRNMFGVTLEKDKTYNIEGTVGKFGDVIQVYPTEVTEVVGPTIEVNPESVNIEDATGDNKSTSLTASVTPSGTVNASLTDEWTWANSTVTYNGKKLHAEGVATFNANGASDVTVDLDYLYTGPLYIVGYVNGGDWSANNMVQMTLDPETGLYSVTTTTTPDGDGYSYISFSKRMGSEWWAWNEIRDYRFVPASNGEWVLTDATIDEYCALDFDPNHVDDQHIKMPAGTYTFVINPVTNQFMIRYVETVATPTFSPAEGTFDEAQSVSISCATDGATIYYTTDGTEPTTSSTVYGDPINVSENTTIKAIAVKNGMNKSEVASATYVINIISSGDFTLVTDASQLATGNEVIIVNRGTAGAARTMGQRNTSNYYGTAVTVTSSKTVEATEDTEIFTLESGTNGWYFKTDDNLYLTSSSGTTSNTLNTKAKDGNGENTSLASITIESGNIATIVFQGEGSRKNLRYNANNITTNPSNHDFFSCYTSTSQADVYIYKRGSQITTLSADKEHITLVTPAGADASEPQTFTVTGSNLTENVTITVDNANFEIDPTTIAPVDGSVSQVVTVTYVGESAVTENAIITITSSGKTVEIDVHGSKAAATLAQIESNTDLLNKKVTVDGQLIGAWAVNNGTKKLLWAKDQGQASINKRPARTEAQDDYMVNRMKYQHYEFEGDYDWDESNWVILDFANLDGEDPENYVGHKLANKTVTGTYDNAVDYTITLTKAPTKVDEDKQDAPEYPGYAGGHGDNNYGTQYKWAYNTYMPANFMPDNLNHFDADTVAGAHSGENALPNMRNKQLYFMNPKFMEVAHLWGVWCGQGSDKFTIYATEMENNQTINAWDLHGAIDVLSWEYNRLAQDAYGAPQGLDQTAQDFHAIIVRKPQTAGGRHNAPSINYDDPSSDEYGIYPLDMPNGGQPTAVKDLTANKQIQSVRYYNVMGIEAGQPHQGVNIVVTRFNDGSTSTIKVLF